MRRNFNWELFVGSGIPIRSEVCNKIFPVLEKNRSAALRFVFTISLWFAPIQQSSYTVICPTSFTACEDIAPLWFLLDKLLKKPPKIFTHCEGWTKVDGNIFWKHCVSNVAAVSWHIVHLDAVWFDLIPLVNLFNRYDLNLHKKIIAWYCQE